MIYQQLQIIILRAVLLCKNIPVYTQVPNTKTKNLGFDLTLSVAKKIPLSGQTSRLIRGLSPEDLFPIRAVEGALGD